MGQIIVAIGAGLCAVGVGVGAFGAHGLKGILDSYGKEIFEKAVFYHFVHAIGIMVVGMLVRQDMLSANRGVWLSALFGCGIVVFSGSLYLLAITGMKWLGAITPIGGTLFIVSWILLALFTALR
jgi:uncharacterized membrane protein YgdD (TMEM256/DUF423 family)